ncbi:MAG: hypothetical protein M3M96_01575 [Candidatus Eremiobacteraeota bacterium]|nr:hypothetical protein [Candidatus Eremiobacteraeota bacterium]
MTNSTEFDLTAETAVKTLTGGPNTNATPTAPVSTTVSVSSASNVFERLHEELRQDRKPVGARESLLVRRIAVYALRVEQAEVIEEDFFRRVIAASPAEPDPMLDPLLKKLRAVIGRQPTPEQLDNAIKTYPEFRVIAGLISKTVKKPRLTPYDTELLQKHRRNEAAAVTALLSISRELDRVQNARLRHEERAIAGQPARPK